MKSPGFLLSVIVVGALVLRVWNLSAQSLDIDEYTELQVRYEAYTEAACKADSMPPLYPVLLKTWLAVWPSDRAGRGFFRGYWRRHSVGRWNTVGPMLWLPVGNSNSRAAGNLAAAYLLLAVRSFVWPADALDGAERWSPC